MSKRKGVPRMKVKTKSMTIEFTKLQKRLIGTIQAKYNQAMNSELNSALVDIYEEHGFTIEDIQDDYRIRPDLTGLDLVPKASSMGSPGDVTIPGDIVKEIEKKEAEKEKELNA